ncbi:hypothetical protein BCR34DRAFT_584306 [Clohesyomyces aquaticus]|uniref:Uncharacterized protein n=1 Tax=Clohesyomyces aquaticus TaxID=1231657 RepID=A0A1Y2A2X8_9PLEO|nr:hypothetical protein BCR34DRAFT_584306 [Clohesyomyces aquaticus]
MIGNTALPILASPNPVLPTNPPPTTKDGLLLVNSEKDGVWTSGLAWYADIGSNRDGNRPDAYVDIKTDGTVTWEGVNYGTFPDGNQFWASIAENAHDDSVPLYSEVGNAGNSYHGMRVFKDRWRVMYEIDGWKCYTLYWCT